MPSLVEQMGPLAAVLQAVAGLDAEPPGDRPTLKVAVLRNFTVEGIEPLFKYLAHRSGFVPKLTLGDYDNVRQEVLSPDSHVYASSPDIVVLALLVEHLDPGCLRSDWDPTKARNAIVETLADLVSRSRALIMVGSLLPPLRYENALLAQTTPHRASQVRAINAELRAFAAKHAHRVFVIDAERILGLLGEERSLDRRFGYMSRAPFKKDFLAHYAWEVVRAGRALHGKAKKCLVLDCDNTLWGGVVGEDGATGIKLDPFEYPGRCFFDFQSSVLNLLEQGVIVALCSKNNEADALEVIDNHPHCLLRRHHLAAWRIDWNDKASNIASLANQLNLGLDSFVFVDDSSIECDLVRSTLPDVTVLQAPKSAFELPDLLYRDGLFDGVVVRSEEDAKRTASYVAERERSEAQTSFATTEEYLASLELKATIHRAPPAELARVAQLLGKTNQFNLTTRRHSEAVVRELADSPDAAIYSLSAADRFGDLGLVAVMIVNREQDEGRIDTLLMSCRALGRRLEHVFVEHCLGEIEARWRLKKWRAAYLPTKKNGQVAEFWDSLGFARAGTTEGGGVTYEQDVSTRRRTSFPFVSVSGADHDH